MKLTVAALGNRAMSDDALGPLVLDCLKKKKIPGTFLDLSVPGATGYSLVLDTGKVLLLDTAHGGHPPGTVYRFPASCLPPESDTAGSLHQLTFLQLAARINPKRLCDIIVLAMEPGNLEPGTGLSAPVRQMLPLFCRLVKREICRLTDARQSFPCSRGQQPLPAVHGFHRHFRKKHAEGFPCLADDGGLFPLGV